MPTAILVADDDPVTRGLLDTLLEKLGFQVIAVSDGNEALRLLKEEQAPRFAILGCAIPGLDGLEIVKQLRAAGTQPYTYILLLTAKDKKENVLLGLSAGADDYLIRPFDADELKARVLIGKRILDVQHRLLSALEIAEFRGTHDVPTGLYNRAAILELLRGEAARSRRENLDLTLVMLDVDNFKAINDAYGQLVGDEVLKLLALRIKSALRSYDYLGRCGGEEFMIIASHCQLQDGLAIAERIRSCIASDSFLIRNLCIQVRVSLGVVAASGGGADPGSLLASAYTALDLAKSGGGNRVESIAKSAAAGCGE